MNLRRRKVSERPTVGSNREPGEVVALVSRLESQRDQLWRALSSTPAGVGFVQMGDDYLPTDDVARQLADTEVLLQTARHRLRRLTTAT